MIELQKHVLAIAISIVVVIKTANRFVHLNVFNTVSGLHNVTVMLANFSNTIFKSGDAYHMQRNNNL